MVSIPNFPIITFVLQGTFLPANAAKYVNCLQISSEAHRVFGCKRYLKATLCHATNHLCSFLSASQHLPNTHGERYFQEHIEVNRGCKGNMKTYPVQKHIFLLPQEVVNYQYTLQYK